MSTKRAVVDRRRRPAARGSAARAHHAFSAEFDVNKPMKLQGTLDEVGDDQSPLVVSHRRQRRLTAGGPLDDRRRQSESADSTGRDEEHADIGTEFLIEGYQARDGTNKGVGRNFSLPMDARSSWAARPQERQAATSHRPHSPSQGYFPVYGLAHRTRKPVLIVLDAVVLHDLAARNSQSRREVHRERPRVGPRIVDRDGAVQRREGVPRPSLDHVQLLRVRSAVLVQPEPVVEADRVDHERVSFPFARSNARTSPARDPRGAAGRP